VDSGCWGADTVPIHGVGSWTRAGEPYVYHSWGFAVIAASCHRLAGDAGLICLRALLAAACSFFLTLAVSVRQACGAWVLLFPGLALLFGFTNLFWPVRPQSASQALLALLLLILSRDATHGGRCILLAVPLTFLWANLHGGSLLGVVILILAVAGNFVDSWRKQTYRTADWVWRGVAVGLCFLASFATPYGFQGLFSALRHIGGEFAATAPMEWGTPRIAEHPLFVLLLILAAAGLISALLSGRFRLADSLLFILFALMGLRSLRYLEIAAIGLAYTGAASWSSALNKRYSLQYNRLGIASGTLLIAVLLAMGIGRDSFLFQRGWRPGRPLPVAAVQFLSRNKVTSKLLNPYEWGGYLIWEFRPIDIAFVDGRADLYSEAFLKDYLTISAGAEGWKGIVDRHGIQAVLWRAGPNGNPLLEVLNRDPSFIQVYSDTTAVVFVRGAGRYKYPTEPLSGRSITPDSGGRAYSNITP
jgi:hypothetical protein